jgi:hypothetical protein
LSDAAGFRKEINPIVLSSTNAFDIAIEGVSKKLPDSSSALNGSIAVK